MPNSETFQKLLKTLENTPTPEKVTLDGKPDLILDGPEIRLDIYTDFFEKLKKSMENQK